MDISERLFMVKEIDDKPNFYLVEVINVKVGTCKGCPGYVDLPDWFEHEHLNIFEAGLPRLKGCSYCDPANGITPFHHDDEEFLSKDEEGNHHRPMGVCPLQDEDFSSELDWYK